MINTELEMLYREQLLFRSRAGNTLNSTMLATLGGGMWRGAVAFMCSAAALSCDVVFARSIAETERLAEGNAAMGVDVAIRLSLPKLPIKPPIPIPIPTPIGPVIINPDGKPSVPVLLPPPNPLNPLDPRHPLNPLSPHLPDEVTGGSPSPAALDELLTIWELYPAPVRAIPGFDRWFSEQVKQTGRDLGKGGEHLLREIGRGGENVAEAVRASGHYINRQIVGVGEIAEDAGERLRDGKVVDAFWHAMVDPYRHTEKNAAAAVQESSMLRTVAQVTASVYGGPGGAAAFAAWYAYNVTGDAELALRVGAIAGASSAALSGIGEMPDDLLVQKATMAGAVGGLGVALNGGDTQAVQEAFLRGGGMILIQDGYRRAVNMEDISEEDQLRLDRERLQSARGPALCMATLDPNAGCRPPDGALVKEGDKLVDIDWSKGKPDSPHVGIMSKSPAELEALAESQEWREAIQPLINTVVGETGPVMTTIANVPGMNAMSLFHDRWSVVWDMDSVTNIATIAPATVLVYIGTEAPLQDHLLQTAIDGSRQPILAPAPPAPPAADGALLMESPAAGEDIEDTPVRLATDAMYYMPQRGEHTLSLVGREIGLQAIDCFSGTDAVFITLNGPDASGTLCSVALSDDDRLRGLWHAHREESFCREKAAELVGRMVDVGMACFARNRTGGEAAAR